MSGCKNIYNVIFVVHDMKYITLILDYGCNLSNDAGSKNKVFFP